MKWCGKAGAVDHRKPPEAAGSATKPVTPRARGLTLRVRQAPPQGLFLLLQICTTGAVGASGYVASFFEAYQCTDMNCSPVFFP
jgi:hypothetical protein